MMRFAEKLGAETVILSGQDVADTLIDYARSKNISKIIMGKPGKPTWHEFIFGSIINRLARKCQEIDLYLLSGDVQGREPEKFEAPALKPFPWDGLRWTIMLVLLCTAIDGVLLKYLKPVDLIMVYMMGVTLVAFRYGRRMSVIAAFLSVAFFDYFFVPPCFSFEVEDAQYLTTLGAMLVIGFTVGSVTGRLRQQAISMRRREERMQVLYQLNRDLAKTSDTDEIFKIALKKGEEFFKCPIVILLPNEVGRLLVKFGDIEGLPLTANEQAVAQWVYEHDKMAGKDTDTLPGSKGVYLPFTGAEKTVGVIGLFPLEDKQLADPEQLHILEMFVSQTALAVEGAQLAVEAIKSESDIENERLRNMLLSTFSMDLPVPLKAISQAADDLIRAEGTGDKTKSNELIHKIRDEARKLSSLSHQMGKILKKN